MHTHPHPKTINSHSSYTLFLHTPLYIWPRNINVFEWQGPPMAWWGVESFMGPLPYFLSHLGERGLDCTGGLPTSGSRIRPWSLGSRTLESLSGRVARCHSMGH